MSCKEEIERSEQELKVISYAGEPCRICGEVIQQGEAGEAVFMGYSRGCTARAAHGYCFTENIEKEHWVFSVDLL